MASDWKSSVSIERFRCSSGLYPRTVRSSSSETVPFSGHGASPSPPPPLSEGFNLGFSSMLSDASIVVAGVESLVSARTPSVWTARRRERTCMTYIKDLEISERLPKDNVPESSIHLHRCDYRGAKISFIAAYQKVPAKVPGGGRPPVAPHEIQIAFPAIIDHQPGVRQRLDSVPSSHRCFRRHGPCRHRRCPGLISVDRKARYTQ